MSDPAAVAMLTYDAFVLTAVMVFPKLRRRVFEVMRSWVLAARRIYIENPLRLATGRRRPDYARIAELERTELPSGGAR